MFLFLLTPHLQLRNLCTESVIPSDFSSAGGRARRQQNSVTSFHFHKSSRNLIMQKRGGEQDTVISICICTLRSSRNRYSPSCSPINDICDADFSILAQRWRGNALFIQGLLSSYAFWSHKPFSVAVEWHFLTWLKYLFAHFGDFPPWH